MSTEIVARQVRDWRGWVPSHVAVVSPRVTPEERCREAGNPD